MTARMAQKYSSQLEESGFTLIEALIAIFIFSWIGLGAYQILDQITRAKEISAVQSQRLATFQRLGWRLSRDYRQMVPRKITDEHSDEKNWLIHESEDYLIEFTRTGWSNPLEWPRSDLQRVAYTIDYHPKHNDSSSEYYKDERLYLLRYYWQVLDRTLDTKPRVQAVLANVADFQTRYWDRENDEWSDTPIPGNGSIQIPLAYEVNIVLEDEQVLSYIFKAR